MRSISNETLDDDIHDNPVSEPFQHFCGGQPGGAVPGRGREREMGLYQPGRNLHHPPRSLTALRTSGAITR